MARTAMIQDAYYTLRSIAFDERFNDEVRCSESGIRHANVFVAANSAISAAREAGMSFCETRMVDASRDEAAAFLNRVKAWSFSIGVDASYGEEIDFGSDACSLASCACDACQNDMEILHTESGISRCPLACKKCLGYGFISHEDNGAIDCEPCWKCARGKMSTDWVDRRSVHQQWIGHSQMRLSARNGLRVNLIHRLIDRSGLPTFVWERRARILLETFLLVGCAAPVVTGWRSLVAQVLVGALRLHQSENGREKANIIGRAKESGLFLEPSTLAREKVKRLLVLENRDAIMTWTWPVVVPIVQASEARSFGHVLVICFFATWLRIWFDKLAMPAWRKSRLEWRSSQCDSVSVGKQLFDLVKKHESYVKKADHNGSDQS